MNDKPLKIVSTEFTLSFKGNLKAIRPLLGPLLNLFFLTPVFGEWTIWRLHHSPCKASFWPWTAS
jgi:hypothetical protein